MDFIILKVNGTDVSSFPHEDAVQAFLTAKEPIVVEVKRRNVDSSSEKAISSPDLVSTGVQTELSGFTWMDDNSLDCFAHDIDLEEVTLRKCSSDEKLGLTVCYSSGSEVDTCTEVYIRDIAPQSVAEKDGRLRQGDQILQVNGKDVANKEDTELLFAENRKAVTLLISRCFNKVRILSHNRKRLSRYFQNDDYFFTEDPTGNKQQQALYQNYLIQTHEEAPESPQEKLNLTNSLVRSKMDSISHEISELELRMQSIQLVKGDKRKPPRLPDLLPPPESDTEHIYETIPESEDGEPIYSCPYEAEPEDVEKWLEGKWANSSGEEHENSSSAYNTGGSCNSNPLTFELARSRDAKHRSTLVLCPPEAKEDGNETCESCKQVVRKKKVTSPQVTKPVLTPEQLKDTMYTNVANLQQTMMLQQQLFRQALSQDSNICKPTTSFTTPNFTQYQKNPVDMASTLDTRMEWKVKRRSDGSRYIARRPVRNRILKNRALQISEERAGLTTEDDTISELKIGRYWTKDERKRHLEKSRERKQRQEILLASRNLEAGKKSAGEMNVKHKVKKGHKEGFDGFAVQELLVNSAKVSPSSKMVGLLSVTTV